MPHPRLVLELRKHTRRPMSSKMPGRNLNLLSLDGGGVRGLSSLYILQRIMVSIDPDNPPKPCDYFDIIGGTSTGGYVSYEQSSVKHD
jgi:patatin-like phospholipase/acyl hydrolase